MEKSYLTCEEVCEALGCRSAYAYTVIRKLNAELEAKGFFTIAGKINKKYFLERCVYGAQDGDEQSTTG